MKNCPQCFATYPDEYAVCPKDGAALAGAAVWAPSSVIRGKYKILAKIGEGGMAAVFRAQHLLLDEPRALKVIGLELARDEQFVQRFKNEAVNTRKLQHPNAVRVDDLDIAEDGRPFMAMELVEGESLKNRIQRAGPMPVPETLAVASQVCEALQAAHALGLIHRDIKPDNIVLVPRPSPSPPMVKILDFGIARLREASPAAAGAHKTLTGTGVVIGTPEYMSPEQAMGRHGEQLDGRSDLYSLGIVMYRMLTGELPFKAETTVEMILHHIQTVPKPPHAIKPALGIPEAVSAVVMKALEKDREQRYLSAAAMGAAIRQAQSSLTRLERGGAALVTGAQAATPAPPRPAPSPPAGVAQRPAATAARTAGLPPSEVKRFPVVPTLVGILLLALIVAYVVASRRGGPAPRQPEPTPVSSRPAEKPPAPSGQGAEPATQPTTSVEQEPTEEGASSAHGVGEPAEEAARQSPPVEVSPPSRRIARDNQPQHDPAPARRQRVEQEIRRLHESAARALTQGNYVHAAKAFRDILALDPDNKRAQTGLRMTLQALKRGRHPRGRFKP